MVQRYSSTARIEQFAREALSLEYPVSKQIVIVVLREVKESENSLQSKGASGVSEKDFLRGQGLMNQFRLRLYFISVLLSGRSSHHCTPLSIQILESKRYAERSRDQTSIAISSQPSGDLFLTGEGSARLQH